MAKALGVSRQGVSEMKKKLNLGAKMLKSKKSLK